MSELAISSWPTPVPKLDSDSPCDLQTDNNNHVAVQPSAHGEVQEEQNEEKEKHKVTSGPGTSEGEINLLINHVAAQLLSLSAHEEDQDEQTGEKEEHATSSSPSPSKTEIDLIIDRVAAQLLSLSATDDGQKEGEMEKNMTKSSPSTSESEIEINLPSTWSNSITTPFILSGRHPRFKTEILSHEDNSRFKTEICRSFKEKGSCLYGDHCQFAHGKDEMRDVGEQSKYKTKRCQKFWNAGYCAYGPRCNFLHYEEEDQVKPKHCSGQILDTMSRTFGPAAGSNLDRSNTAQRISPGGIKSMLPPTPVPLSMVFRPVHGSGRMAAVINNGEYYWIDTRTQQYV